MKSQKVSVGQREQVFKEFTRCMLHLKLLLSDSLSICWCIRLGQSVDRFLSKYPEAEMGFTQLLKAIHMKIKAWRRSKYGATRGAQFSRSIPGS